MNNDIGILESQVTERRWLNLLFIAALAVSLGLWCYSVLTTTIDSYQFRFLDIFSKMPLTFWVGWGFLVLATIAWYFSRQTHGFHLLLAFSWMLFLLLAPELMEVNARGQDTFGHLVGVTFYEQGRFQYPEVSYSAFPGFHFLALPLYKITGVGYYGLAKLLAIAFHIVKLAAIWFLGSQLFKEKKAILFFTLLLLAFLWDNQQFDPGNQNMGFIFVLLILACFFTPGMLNLEKRLLMVILYAAIVTTHPLSAIVVLLTLSFFVIMGLTGKDFGYNKDINGATLLLLFGVGFAAWALYSSDWVITEAIHMLRVLFTEQPLLPVSEVMYATQEARTYAILVYSFFALLLIWGLTIVFNKEFLSKLSVRRVFPVLCIFPLVVTQFLGVWALPRYYMLSTPFIAWFLARERATRKNIALFFLIVCLLFSFTLRYYAEYFDYNTTTDIYGARFIAEKIPSSATYYRADRSNTTVRSLSNTLDVPYWVDSRDLYRYAYRPGDDFQYSLDSERQKNIVIFKWGEERWNWVKEVLSANEAGIIYSNGEIRIRAYRSSTLSSPDEQ